MLWLGDSALAGGQRLREVGLYTSPWCRLGCLRGRTLSHLSGWEGFI